MFRCPRGAYDFALHGFVGTTRQADCGGHTVGEHRQMVRSGGPLESALPADARAISFSRFPLAGFVYRRARRALRRGELGCTVVAGFRRMTDAAGVADHRFSSPA